MTGLEVAVGFLIAWAVRKAKRVGGKLDDMADQALDAGLDRLRSVVEAKLGTDPALAKLELEASQTGEVGTRTQARVRMALEDAAEEDPAFATQLQEAIKQLEPAQGTVAGHHGVAISGGVRADNSGIAIGGITGGSVNFTDPRQPGRP